ncbi:hypothetical protein ACFQ9Z_09255 [Streptomyces sp. NPDC056580]|uniref:hypothetical protein n=1 Tax=Streptomyces sp. NPDC056580 TaxID=3345872 RepID=UPI00367A30E4
MRKGSHAYEQALDALIGILRDGARKGAEPLQYGQLSDELQRLDHPVPAHEGPMPHLLEDASARGNPDGSLPMLSALVVRQETRMPSGGFFKLARRAPYRRTGDDVELWVNELRALAAHHSRR